jgi:hypothetical protein
MNTQSKRLGIAAIFFAISVLLFTGLDFLVNSTLYGFGLQFNDGWYSPYTLLYSLLYQIIIVCLGFYCKSWRFLIVAESFVLSGTQDIVYFALWNHGVFPVDAWSWIMASRIGITWTTQLQFVWSAVALSVGVLAAYFLPRRASKLKVP